MSRADVRDWPDLQAACDQGAADGTPLVLEERHRVELDGPLLVDSWLDLLIRGELRKAYPAKPGTRVSWIRNRDLTAKVRNVRLRTDGSGVIGATSHDMTGNLVALHGDDLDLRTRVDCWHAGRALILAGDRIKWRGDLSGTLPEEGNGGGRVMGGADFDGAGIIHSGDDTFQFVPAGSPQDPLYDLSITRARWRGVGSSAKGKLMVAGLQAFDHQWGRPPEGPPMTASITDIRYDVAGTGGAHAVALQNLSSSGEIRGVRYANGCRVDMSGSAGKVLAAEVQVYAEDTTGGVHDVSGRVEVVGARTDRMRVARNTSGINLHVA